MLQNTGFIEQAPRETDFIAGSSSVTPLNHPTGNWFNSLPSDERQSGGRGGDGGSGIVIITAT